MRHFAEHTKWLPVEEIREKIILNGYFRFWLPLLRTLCVVREEAIIRWSCMGQSETRMQRRNMKTQYTLSVHTQSSSSAFTLYMLSRI